jgi:hypothetical protein
VLSIEPIYLLVENDTHRGHPHLGQAGHQRLDDRGRHRRRPAVAVGLKEREDQPRHPERLGGLVGDTSINRIVCTFAENRCNVINSLAGTVATNFVLAKSGARYLYPLITIGLFDLTSP